MIPSDFCAFGSILSGNGINLYHSGNCCCSYSVGHSFLVLIAGTSVGFVHKVATNESYGKLSQALKILMGAIILMLAFYMFYLGF